MLHVDIQVIQRTALVAFSYYKITTLCVKVSGLQIFTATGTQIISAHFWRKWFQNKTFQHEQTHSYRW